MSLGDLSVGEVVILPNLYGKIKYATVLQVCEREYESMTGFNELIVRPFGWFKGNRMVKRYQVHKILEDNLKP